MAMLAGLGAGVLIVSAYFHWLERRYVARQNTRLSHVVRVLCAPYRLKE